MSKISNLLRSKSFPFKPHSGPN